MERIPLLTLTCDTVAAVTVPVDPAESQGRVTGEFKRLQIINVRNKKP